MYTALLCFGLLLCAFLAQMVWWRLRLPLMQRRALLAITGVLQGLFYVAAGLGAATLWECAQVTIFFVPLMLAYIAFYTAIEADSPSMAIVSQVAAAGRSGLTGEALAEYFARIDPLEQRIEAMIVDGMIERKDERISLLPKGRRMAKLFAASAAILGLRKGG